MTLFFRFLFDVVLLHLLLEDVRDDPAQLFTFFFRKLTRFLCDGI